LTEYGGADPESALRWMQNIVELVVHNHLHRLTTTITVSQPPSHVHNHHHRFTATPTARFTSRLFEYARHLGVCSWPCLFLPFALGALGSRLGSDDRLTCCTARRRRDACHLKILCRSFAEASLCMSECVGGWVGVRECGRSGGGTVDVTKRMH
jgi:hypothetical protein